jgi:hypothetical protein
LYRLTWFIIRFGPAQSCIRLGTAAQEVKGAVGIFHKLPLFMVVAIVLQIPQTAVNCCFSRIHALNEPLRV